MAASGMTNQEIMDDYPSIKQEQILAALAFAANRESIIKMVAAWYEIAVRHKYLVAFVI